MRAPPVLHLGLHNSLADSDAPTGGSCQVTLFAPYWLNNRTGAWGVGWAATFWAANRLRVQVPSI